MENRFTARHAFGIICGVLFGVFTFNALHFFEVLNIPFAIGTLVTSILLGCFIGEPKQTTEAFKKALATLSKISIFFTLTNFIVLLYVLGIIAGIYNCNFGSYETNTYFSAIFADDKISEFMFLGFVFLLLSGAISAELLKKVIKEKKIYALIPLIVMLTLSNFVMLLGMVVLFIFSIAVLVLFLFCAIFVALTLLNLFAKHQTETIALSVTFGTLIGVSLGWTQMEPVLLTKNMLIGGVSGSMAGWMFNQVGNFIFSFEFVDTRYQTFCEKLKS